MSDRVVVMESGRIAQIGTPREVYEEPSSLYVARFIGDINLFPGTVRERLDGEHLHLDIFGQAVIAQTKKTFTTGQAINLLLRPEDLRLGECIPNGAPSFSGAIIERSYRGSTLDTTIRLDYGPILKACEFFDEDDPDFDYRVGERVQVSWVKGWEVVLADEK